MIKRLFDLLLATFLLALTLPIFIIVTVILALQGGSIIFRQKRIGKDGKIFTCYKFRSMIENAENQLPIAAKVYWFILNETIFPRYC